MRHSKKQLRTFQKVLLFLIRLYSILVIINLITMAKDLVRGEDSAYESSEEGLQSFSEESQSLRKKQKNHLKRKQTRKRKLQIEKAKFKEAFWTLEENLRYIAFLKVNKKLFSLSVVDRKKVKINIKLSEWVGTRSADQSRSHHQKMLQYHQNIDGIIAHVEKEENQRILKRNNEMQAQDELSGPLLKEQRQPVSTLNSLEDELWNVLNLDLSQKCQEQEQEEEQEQKQEQPSK